MRGVLFALSLGCALPVAAEEYHRLEGHGGPVMDIAVGSSGKVATASFDNAVGLWSDAEPAWQDGHEAAVNTVHFLSDRALVSGADDFDLIRWDLVSGGSERLEGHQGKVMALASSEEFIASASWDGSVGLWPRGGGAPRFLLGHDGPVNDVAFADGGALLYSASADGTIRTWAVDTGTEQTRVVEHGFGLNELVLDEGAGWLAYGAVDGVTRVIELGTGRSLADLTLDRRPILALARSQDGARLAIGDGEGFISVIATEDWSIERDFRAATRGPIWALAFAPSSEMLYAAGLDTAVHAWPVATLSDQEQMQTEDAAFLSDPDEMPNGERQFKRKCSICHTLTPGSARRAGPSLHDLFGRRAGTVDDYTYSDALEGSDLVWTEETVDALFDIGPEHYIPGTKMPMQRITGAEDRADLIAYLRQETAPTEDQE
ncbi:c-type cytochrome [Roseivivax sp. THAF30]|uniref:c-type cytochrome n=1 Tax=Roseivivax sp. THAF30 TaxID=2587852 RepID=UPI00126843B4|nr:c-type cytochrome [Roseivivax sp. THAF30]QFT62303.1 Cytochrome c2 precursor [Roseivivax sp. THAF30]